MQTSEIIGWVGTTLIIAAFFLISYNFISSSDPYYQLMNFAGALALFYTALTKKSPSIATLQILWAVIAMSALFKIIF